MITLSAYYLLKRSRKVKDVSELDKAVDELQHLEYGPQEFSYRELLLATKKFSHNEIIGKGGFGTVYRGSLPRFSPRCRGKAEGLAMVAVKRIRKTSSQGVKDFVAEIKLIGRLRHHNMVPLLGWCHHKEEMLLVYEYMPNGNLQELLFSEDNADKARSPGDGGTSCPWKLRMKVLRGVAAALVFLHEDCAQRVVHRDVKSNNVLLDEEFNARLGDFGLARLYERGEDHHSTVVAGTIGYLAPESIVMGNATSKSDVYSFGALALEVATGRKPADWRIPGERGLVQWVWKLHSQGRLTDAIDIRLGTNYNSEEMKRVLKAGLFCCLPDPDARPTMREVQTALQIDSPIISSELPPIPDFDYDMNMHVQTLSSDSFSFTSTDSDLFSNYTSSSDWVPQSHTEKSPLLEDSSSATRKESEKESTKSIARSRSWS